MRKTKIEIIEETANYYRLDNRSIEKIDTYGNNRCMYINGGGKRCAIGRICQDDADLAEFEGQGVDWDITVGEKLLERLKDEYRGHGLEFYGDIQRLHDCHANWTDVGLSNRGKEEVERLKSKWL